MHGLVCSSVVGPGLGSQPPCPQPPLTSFTPHTQPGPIECTLLRGRPRLCLSHDECLTVPVKALSGHVPKIRRGRGSQDEEMENLNSVFSLIVMPLPPRALSSYSEEFGKKRQPARIPRWPGLWEGTSTMLVTSHQLKMT